MTADDSDDLIESIAPDVMRVLNGRRFFEKLDDKLCPVNESEIAEKCSGTYAISKALLSDLGFNEEDLNDILAVLQSRGGFCDCEILYNASDANRLKAKYWKSRAESPTVGTGDHSNT